MPEVHLAVHGHFYQPPRENPWTETVPVEPSAAPFHDWNERITAESYQPNAHARIFDEQGRVVAIVNNYAHLSFDVGPTLVSWLVDHHPDVLERMVVADGMGGGAVAQGYSHLILPLADERDVRTQIRWGLADFHHRFGRPARGIWLPEAGVDDVVLRVVAEEGLGFVILAPGQAARVRPLDADEDAWVEVNGDVDTTHAYRWLDPEREGLAVDLVFYRGDLSHDVAFGLGGLSSQELVARVAGAAPGGGLVCIAADGETFGHHHRWADRALAYALAVEAPRAGVRVGTVEDWLAAHPPAHQAQIHVSSWSCAHGVERWRSDCGCATGGEPSWHQRWRAPLREALDLLRDAAREVFERRGAGVLRDAWAARDAYVDVLLGRVGVDDFVAAHVEGDPVEALTLLESQRHAMSMYTSCGWFFNDLAGIETLQVLRYAARVMDLLAELGEQPPHEAFLDVLAKAESNRAAEGSGRDVWARHVEPARVGPERVVAHLALLDLLEDQPPAPVVGAHRVVVEDHARSERGSLALTTGVVTLTHVRTRRTSRHAFAAVHLGGLEVLGATRPADDTADPDALRVLRDAFAHGARVTRLLQLLPEFFGGHEFGVEDAIADEPDQLLHTAADALADRFLAACARILDDQLATLRTLARAGYPIPPELKAPAEVVLTRRFEEALASGALDSAAGTLYDARGAGLAMDTPAAVAAAGRVILATTLAAVEQPDGDAVERALAVLELAADMEVTPDVERAQEAVYEALVAGGAPELRPLGEALGLAVDRLGVPS